MKTRTSDLKTAPDLREKNAFLFYKITASKAGLKQGSGPRLWLAPQSFKWIHGDKWQKWTTKGSLGWDPAGHTLNFPHQASLSYHRGFQREISKRNMTGKVFGSIAYCKKESRDNNLGMLANFVSSVDWEGTEMGVWL